jgi:tRNA A-37 threonylcarbamoyl transferase component Bud32
MTGEPQPDVHDERLQEAISSYLEAWERGQVPHLAEYLARYPDCAAELTAFDADHRRMHGLFSDLRAPTTIDHASRTGSRQAVKWVRVAPTAATAPTLEVREGLRKRLRALALFMAVGIGVSRAIGLAFDYPSVLDNPLTAFTRSPCYGNSFLVVCAEAVLVVLLSPRRSISLTRLRVLELLGFALPALAVAWNDVLELAELAPAIDGRYGLTIAYATSLPWVLFMVGYGVLIPNTWRRCAAIVSLFALLGLVPDIVALLGYGVAAGPLAVYLAYKVFWISLAATIVIYGARRLEILRQEATEARRLGQYQLKGLLGSGGMGEVYLGEHVLLRRPCAVKLIRPERLGDPKNLARFEREVRATATLTHPNTVQVFDYGHTEDGTFYYIMEYLEGITLEQLVQEHGPLPAERAVHLLRQVCGALQEAHANQMIHRDVKPRNILVCRQGGLHDVVKLLDFGLVRIQGGDGGAADLTAEHAITGTPAYMSPEQAAGRAEVDGRADLYSLGAVAYFLLTGRPPFVNRSLVELLAAHQRDRPEPLTRFQPAVPVELEAVVLRCLAKDPAERFADARTLERALTDWASATGRHWGEEEAVAWWRTR